MNGMNTQASITMIERRAIHGRGEEGRIVPAEMAGERGRRAEAVLHQRLADHPAHRHRAQHERQQEGDAEELARPDLGIQQKRQAEGDRIFERAPPARNRPCCASAFQ